MKQDKNLLLKALASKRKKDALKDFPKGYKNIGNYFPEMLV